MNRVRNACQSLGGSFQGTFLELGDKTLKDKVKSNEDLEFLKKDDFLEMCSVFENWPKDRGIFIGKGMNFFVKVNNLDQLEIIYSDQQVDISQFFRNLFAIVDKLDKALSFYHDDVYGFVTTLPKHLGSTLET